MQIRLVLFCSLLYFVNIGVISALVNETQSKEDDLIVDLQNCGKIRGHILQSATGKNFYAFQDIPYAEPPTGNRRFRPPEPHGPWDGVLDATQNRKVCPQIYDPNSSEDCLVLNVYTPVQPSSGKQLPVFFWIHGGAFVAGSGSIYSVDPRYLIDYDVIIVTVNYRVGAFGFLTTLDENIPGNLGLKDQLLALKWTYQYIQSFGGDPNKITVGGESAGSMSAGFHLLSKSAKGLFRGIIQQSGSSLSTVFYPTNDRELAFQFGKALNPSFASDQSSDLLNLLQQASYSDLMALQSRFYGGRIAGFMDALTFKPVLEPDVTDAFVTEPMHGSVLDGHFNLVPILIGFNSEESLMFFASTAADRAGYYDQSPANVVSQSLNVAQQDRETVGRSLKSFYTSSSFSQDMVSFIRYTSDEVFCRSIIRQAEGASQYVPVYMYELSWLPNGSTDLGVPHAADLWYFFGGQDSPNNNYNLRKPMLKWWTNFIKYGNPTPESDQELQNVIWPKVQPNAVKYLDINNQFTVKDNPRNYNNIKNLLDHYIQKPFIAY